MMQIKMLRSHQIKYRSGRGRVGWACKLLIHFLRRRPNATGLHAFPNRQEKCQTNGHAQTIPGLVVYRFYGPLIFADVRFIIERIKAFIVRESTPVKQVIVDARAITNIDITAVEQLGEFVSRLRKQNIKFVVAKAHLPLRQTATAYGNISEEAWPFGRLQDAIAAFQNEETVSP